MTPEPRESAEQTEGGQELRAANAFDLRRIIGGLFLLYGAIVLVVGLLDSQAEIDKAAGININLIAGLVFLAFGALMVAWGLVRPLGRELAKADAEAARPID